MKQFLHKVDFDNVKILTTEQTKKNNNGNDNDQH